MTKHTCVDQVIGAKTFVVQTLVITDFQTKLHVKLLKIKMESGSIRISYYQVILFKSILVFLINCFKSI